MNAQAKSAPYAMLDVIERLEATRDLVEREPGDGRTAHKPRPAGRRILEKWGTENPPITGIGGRRRGGGNEARPPREPGAACAPGSSTRSWVYTGENFISPSASKICPRRSHTTTPGPGAACAA
jgi:hypothetical protein